MPFGGKSALVRGPRFETEPDHLEIQDEIRSFGCKPNRDEKDATPSEKSIPFWENKRGSDWV